MPTVPLVHFVVPYRRFGGLRNIDREVAWPVVYVVYVLQSGGVAGWFVKILV